MLGCPVFTYWTSEQDPEATWRYLRELDEIGEFVIGSATAGDSDSTVNSYGVTNAHAFSIISVFPLNNEFGIEQHRLYMVRNPWSNTYYSGNFRSSDPAWTDDFKAQIPYGVDPKTSWENGIFFIPDSDFHLAMEYFVVGHHRESEGYSSKWFDQEDDDGEKHTYVIDVPKEEGYLYFTVETYYNKIIPRSCTEDVVPYANIEIFRDGEL